MAFLFLCGLLSICLSSVMSEPASNNGPKWIDMSHTFVENETIYWPGIKPYKQTLVLWGPYPDENGTFMSAFDFEAGEYGGTNIDAPIHFSKTGMSIEQIPLEDNIGDAVVINVTAKAKKDPDYRVVVEDLEEWEKKHGRMPDKPIVFLYTGYGNYWPDREKYFGSKTPDDAKTFHFPGLHVDAAKWLITERNLKMYGVDSASFDPATQFDFPVHQVLARYNISGLENVANLHLLPPRGAVVFVAPMKRKGAAGSPARVFARIGDDKPVCTCGGVALANLECGVVTMLVSIFTLIMF